MIILGIAALSWSVCLNLHYYNRYIKHRGANTVDLLGHKFRS